MSQFRPIALCNVIIKLISKILSNRRQLVMPTLTGLCQSSFIPGRLVTDNIIIAQEIVHSLRQKRGKLGGGFIAKVDLEKAYDHVEWEFLHRILRITGFQLHLQALIMNIVTFTTLRVCWNGEPLAAFHPTHGLRQGDPLSPYLFFLCMETLHHCTSRAIQEKLWIPIRMT